ncbi:MAG: winged helix-turn-helix domain-containing protein [Gemmataceae bacterium]|nr:winged helix-turn-helix domain-containing protein [Gemmataceae bacterium]
MTRPTRSPHIRGWNHHQETTMAAKTAKKSKKPLTVPRRTNLPKLSLLPAAKPEAAKAAAPKAEPTPAPVTPVESTLDTPVPGKVAPAKTGTHRKIGKAAPTRKPSALDAAARVLADAREPMTAMQLVEAMAARGLWSSPGGKTPHATLHAAMSVEIAKKGTGSRFRKAGRGLFAATARAADSTPAEVSGIETGTPELS